MKTKKSSINADVARNTTPKVHQNRAISAPKRNSRTFDDLTPVPTLQDPQLLVSATSQN